MNKQIKELAVQAGVFIEEDMLFADTLNLRMQQFAVLIIQESIAALDNEEEYYGSAILHKHFGVEE